MIFCKYCNKQCKETISYSADFAVIGQIYHYCTNHKNSTVKYFYSQNGINSIVIQHHDGYHVQLCFKPYSAKDSCSLVKGFGPAYLKGNDLIFQLDFHPNINPDNFMDKFKNLIIFS